MLKIGFLGASKAATTLARYFTAKGINVVGFYSKSKTSLDETVKLVGCKSFITIDNLITQCDIIFITTKDDVIGNIWQQIDKTLVADKIFCHCSGILNSDILYYPNSFKASFHPIAPFNSKSQNINELNHITFAIEGDNHAITILQKILQQINNPYIILDKNKKTHYHVACVLMTSLYLSLISLANELIDDAILENHSSNNARILSSLTNSIIQKIKEGQSLDEIITGPLIREDHSTINTHISSLTDEHKLLYQLLSKQLLKILPLNDISKENLLSSLGGKTCLT